MTNYQIPFDILDDKQQSVLHIDANGLSFPDDFDNTPEKLMQPIGWQEMAKVRFSQSYRGLAYLEIYLNENYDEKANPLQLNSNRIKIGKVYYHCDWRSLRDFINGRLEALGQYEPLMGKKKYSENTTPKEIKFKFIVWIGGWAVAIIVTLLILGLLIGLTSLF